MQPRPPHFPEQPQQKSNWWFSLGHEPFLSAAEIVAVLGTAINQTGNLKLVPKTGDPLLLELSESLDPLELIRRLGGTIKIGRELGQNLSEEALIEAMVRELREVEGKINFGISVYSSMSLRGGTLAMTNTIEEWGKKIKGLLKDEGRSVRYVFKKEMVLSSATVVNNGLDKRGREFLVEKTNATLALAKTMAVQPFEEFSRRDFGRPGRDNRSGMLPPKLAMMMINLAGIDFGARHTAAILDPFCGSGTILTEAMLLGYNKLIGADVSGMAVEDTKKNIAWTIAQPPLAFVPSSSRGEGGAGDVRVFQSDIGDLHKKITLKTIDAIVTEPFLGPPLHGRETPEQIKKTGALLADLYLASFSQFKKMLKNNGKVVFIIPRFKINNRWHAISDRLVPEIEKLEFKKERLLPPALAPEFYLLYHRPSQFVGREIWKFTSC